MLTDRVVSRLRYGPDVPRKNADARGLYLLLTPTAKLWRYDFRLDGKRRTMAIGAYPDVSLAQARERLQAARALVADGRDPVTAAKEARARQRGPSTFEAIAVEWMATRRIRPATKKKLDLMLAVYLFPALGSRDVVHLTAPDVLHVIRPIEARKHHDTAHRCLQLVGQVLRYAVATGRATIDITRDLRGALTPVQTTHHAAPTAPAAIQRLLVALDEYDGSPVVRAMLRLAPLVFVRPGVELRLARWSEIDFEAGLWRIPAERMKLNREHIVPLSRQAVAILTDLRRLTGSDDYVFVSPRTGRPLSNMALNVALRTMAFSKTEINGHGFRAMARTLLDEHLRVQPDIIEVQLAHQVTGPLGGTYNRALYLEARVKMMQDYADLLDEIKRKPA